MNAAPILVLQMQRMGDLVLSFPLLGRLAGHFPDHPLWVVGEEAFFNPLMPLSPTATYFGYEAAPGLKNQTYHLVVNLSLRPEAAALAGSLKAEAHIGPVMDAGGRLFIKGGWQLYRASLTHNNRYNLYHWADLNCLDIFPAQVMGSTDWPLPRDLERTDAGARIGLFLGASEPQKHPDAVFWAELSKKLLAAGHKPVLMGGKAEARLGKAVADMLGAPSLNLCGRFALDALARFLGELDLFITPDTGPMHVAAWMGAPVLNLSLGPVNPWETGPFSPQQHVLRAALDCAGCWRCTRSRDYCRQELTAARTAAVVTALFARHKDAPARDAGLEIWRTARQNNGLYDLALLSGPDGPAGLARAARLILSRFWQAWFGALFGFLPAQKAQEARQALRREQPETDTALAAAAADFALALVKNFQAKPENIASTTDFWQGARPLLRPFSGYAQMYAQNELGSRKALARIVSLAEELAAG